MIVRKIIPYFILAMLVAVAGNFCFAQSDTNEQNVPPSKFNSEHFDVPQINVGSEGAIYFPGADEQKELAMSDVKTEVFTDKKKQNKKVLLSWTTAKPAKCVVSYGKAGSDQLETYSESGYQMEHAVMLEQLENSTTYNFTIDVRDRVGAEISSDKIALYTGAAELSFLDLLANAFKGVFGWAMK